MNHSYVFSSKYSVTDSLKSIFRYIYTRFVKKDSIYDDLYLCGFILSIGSHIHQESIFRTFYTGIVIRNSIYSDTIAPSRMKVIIEN
jgi:choline kinase